ncbi:unnamed protein product, partial [marine sediment metagenome]
MLQEVTTDFAGRPLKLEVGRLAYQSDAAVVATYGDTVVLAAVNVTDKPTDMPFMPLRVDFEEKMYSVGRIPGGFFKREGRPSEEAILTCRKIDRPIRPLIPPGMRNDMQIIVLPLSVEADSSVDVISMIAASAGMHISSIPFDGPFGAVRVAQMDGELVLNPAFESLADADMDLLVAGTREGIVQIEMSGNAVGEQVIREGMKLGYEACACVIEAIEQLREKAGKPKGDFPLWEPRAEVVEFINSELKDRIIEALAMADKSERDGTLAGLQGEAVEALTEQGHESLGSDVHEVFEDIIKARLQDLAFEQGLRVDGRRLDEMRAVSCEVGLLPRVHGS